jgi:hypothetical protein
MMPHRGCTIDGSAYCEVAEVGGAVIRAYRRACEGSELVIVRSMNELERRHLGRIPFVHDLPANYTPSDIAVAAG